MPLLLREDRELGCGNLLPDNLRVCLGDLKLWVIQIAGGGGGLLLFSEGYTSALLHLLTQPGLRLCEIVLLSAQRYPAWFLAVDLQIYFKQPGEGQWAWARSDQLLVFGCSWGRYAVLRSVSLPKKQVASIYKFQELERRLLCSFDQQHPYFGLSQEKLAQGQQRLIFLQKTPRIVLGAKD